MRRPQPPRPGGSQAGFSMIEMLMAAFIMAIGLLGLAMLQAMSLGASRGSRSLVTATHVAETVMQQVAMEARTSWLNATNTNQTGAGNANIGLIYLQTAAGGSMSWNNTPSLQYNLQGNVVNANSPDPTQNALFYKVTFTHLDDAGAAVGGIGQISDYQVTVQFADAVDATQTPVTRTVVLSQRLTHG